MTCHQCRRDINVRVEAWHDYDDRALCSLICVYRYRGADKNRKLA